MPTHPRLIEPKSYVLATRRCVDRCFLLSPCKVLNDAIEYCLARTLKRYPGMRVVAWHVMSNHIHVLYFDEHGRGPKFMQDLLSLIARSVNTHWKRREAVWSSDKLNLVTIHSRSDLVTKLAYVLCQAMDAGIVERPEQWAGNKTKLDDLISGRAFTARRPPLFFSPNNPDNKKRVRYRFQFGPDIEDNGELKTALLAELANAVSEQVAHAARVRERDGRRVTGMNAAMADDWRFRPQTDEPTISTLVPTFAASDKALRISLALGIRAFRKSYRESQRAWAAGDHTVIFPVGTYAMPHLPRRIQGRPEPQRPLAA